MREKWERVLAVVLLAALLIVPGVIALLGDEDARVNRFTIDGEPTEEVKVLDIELVEPAWDGSADADGDGIPDGADGMKAGSTVAKDPTVRNIANVDAWIAVEVSVPVATVQTKAEAAAGTAATSRELFSYEVNAGWTEDGNGKLSDDGAYLVRTYLADAALGAGESTPALFDEVTLIDFAPGQVSGDFEVKVYAVGVQKEGFATAAAAYAAYRGDTSGGSEGTGSPESGDSTQGVPYALILDNSTSTASSDARTGYVGDVPMVFIRAEEEPQVGDTHNGLTVSKVYAVDEAFAYNGPGDVTWFEDGSGETVTSVTFEDVVKPVSCSNWFRGMESCTEMDLAKLDVSEVTDMSSMFFGCFTLAKVDGLDSWDTGKVESMLSLFHLCYELAEVDLSGFDMSSVVFADYLLATCMSLTSAGDLSGWDTASMRGMSRMFSDCFSLTSVGDLSGWKTGNVTDMSAMFMSCEALKSIPGLESWDVGNVRAMDDMFNGCKAPAPSWYEI